MHIIAHNQLYDLSYIHFYHRYQFDDEVQNRSFQNMPKFEMSYNVGNEFYLIIRQILLRTIFELSIFENRLHTSRSIISYIINSELYCINTYINSSTA